MMDSDNRIDMDWMRIIAEDPNLMNEVAQIRLTFGDGVAVFGAGLYGRMVCRYLKQSGAKVLCIADNSPSKQGLYIEGIKVVSPLEMELLEPKSVFIAARHAVMPVKIQLDSMSLTNISFDTFFTVDSRERLKNIRDNLLDDERSRYVFDGIISAMLTGRESYCARVMEGNQNFALPAFNNTGKNDDFVDAGAYVGDTVEKFLWSCNGIFNRIYAFEPGLPQFNALNKRMDRLAGEWALSEDKYECVNAGLADKEGAMSLRFEEGTLQTASIEDRQEEASMDGETVLVHALDDYLDGRPATFIKVDIEGMELKMLQGARKTIQKFRPKMSLSIYHKPEDLFTIAEYVKSLVPEYKMAIRHHSPVLIDTMLYCWVED